MAAERGKAWPLAGADLTNQVRLRVLTLPGARGSLSPAPRPQIMDLVQQASNYKMLKKGANEGVLPAPCRLPAHRS
jgi:hypothetical protein